MKQGARWLPLELHTKLKAIAEKEDRSLRAQILYILKQFVSQYKGWLTKRPWPVCVALSQSLTQPTVGAVDGPKYYYTRARLLSGWESNSLQRLSQNLWVSRFRWRNHQMCRIFKLVSPNMWLFNSRQPTLWQRCLAKIFAFDFQILYTEYYMECATRTLYPLCNIVRR